MKTKTTLQKYKAYRNTRWGLFGGMFLTPFIPATILTLMHWDEWFANAGQSLPLGFASLLVSTLLAVVGVWKKNEITNKMISGVFYLAILFICFGATFLFLSSLTTQVGYMFMATAGGLVVGGVCDQLNKSLVVPRMNEYKALVNDYDLDPKALARRERKAKAQAMAEAEAMSHQATE